MLSFFFLILTTRGGECGYELREKNSRWLNLHFYNINNAIITIGDVEFIFLHIL